MILKIQQHILSIKVVIAFPNSMVSVRFLSTKVKIKIRFVINSTALLTSPGPDNCSAIKPFIPLELCYHIIVEWINKICTSANKVPPGFVLLQVLPTVKTSFCKSLSLHSVTVGEVFSCSATTIQALMLALMHIMQIGPKQNFESLQRPSQILALTLQRQQRVDRSSQSCQGCLCQTQLIVRVPYSSMRRYYTADLMGASRQI